jgi:uncharacterized protein YutE (UPF0331/DUF86 family)
LPEPIPREIALRLRGVVDNHHVLELLLEKVTRDDYRAGLRSRDPEELTTRVYPLERAFEIASNYTRELVALGLTTARLPTGDGPSDFRALQRLGVVGKPLRDELIRIHTARNALQHDYPDLRAATVYDGAQLQLTALPRFLKAYVAWLRELGFGRDPI